VAITLKTRYSKGKGVYDILLLRSALPSQDLGQNFSPGWGRPSKEFLFVLRGGAATVPPADFLLESLRGTHLGGERVPPIIKSLPGVRLT